MSRATEGRQRATAHALADWAILTGRLALDGRAAFVEGVRTDPVATVEEMLSRPALRYPDFEFEDVPRRSADIPPGMTPAEARRGSFPQYVHHFGA